MKPLSLFHRIKTALDNEDIEGLLAIGAPTDEYDAEASLIESEIAKTTSFGKKTLSAAQVDHIVTQVWNDMFGPFSEEDLHRRQQAFSSVARKIAE